MLQKLIASKPQRPYRIGIFDSGIGGIQVLEGSLLKFIQDKNIELFYFGDNNYYPYGEQKDTDIIKSRVSAVIKYLYHNKHIDMFINGCYTASTIYRFIAGSVRETLNIDIFDMIGRGSRSAVARTKTGNIAILATSNTINSGIIEKTIHEYNKNIKLHPLATPGLVTLVQEGHTKTKEGLRVISNYLDMIPQEVDTMILGCTHFAYLKPQIEFFLNKKNRSINIIDPTKETAEIALSKLRTIDIPSGNEHIEFYFTKEIDVLSEFQINRALKIFPNTVFLPKFNTSVSSWEDISKSWDAWWKDK